MNIVVLGSGGWGTAAAMLLSDNGHTVALWSHDPKKAELLDKTRENPLLKGVRIPERIAVTSDLAVLQNAEMAVFASPSFALRSVAHEAAPHLKKGTLLVSLTKGIERGTHLRMSEIIAQECGEGYRIAVLSGPSHAEEVARRLPTGCVAASADQASAEAVQRAFMNEVFRVYTHDDVVGVELAGALKNVAALCCGISDGCGMGDNTRALLITRALSEISRLAECMGGRKETLAGLAGMGDLIVTCTSMHSRNHRAGILIGQGKSAQEAMDEVGAVVEGYYAARSAHELAQRYGVEMPILGYGVYLVSPEECERCVLDAISVGYRSIDTAQAYYNEEGVGAAITKCGVPRSELFITTKVWISNAGEGKAAASIDESLRKLRTDYIDLLLIHQPFGDYYGTYRAMEKAVKAGKTRSIGLSNFYPDRFVDLAENVDI